MNDYRWLTERSQQFLENDYLLPNQTVDERVDIICNRAEDILKKPGYAAKLKANIKKGWYSLSTPIWSNFGTARGLPISCFGSYIEDSMPSILYTQAEVGMMSKLGGGTSAYFGKLRGRGSPITDNGESAGAVHFMRLFDTVANIVNQGKTRRGNFAAYLDIDHPDILEFLTIKNEGSPIQDMSFGVCISDDWMNSMIEGDRKKRNIAAKLIESRLNKGYPYIVFTDNVNNNTADVYKDKELTITHSNLCTEIFEPDNSEESFVCDLASLNILYYDEWKDDPEAIEILVYLLDAVMTEFIDKTENVPFLERARKFAINHRAIGLGWLGWHSFLQSKMVPFESMQAKFYNTEIAKHIQSQAFLASQKLATEYGEPPLLIGYGRRNTVLQAIAPTKSSAFILGQVSEGIEPHRANCYIKDLAKGKFTVRNPHLELLLEEKGRNNSRTWNSILKNAGSVQHLDFLTDDEKDVFKTFQEISQKEIIIQVAQRQKYIDQGQSVNLMIHPSTPAKEILALYIEAWKLGVKSLYYQMSVNAAQQLTRSILDCKSCEA